MDTEVNATVSKRSEHVEQVPNENESLNEVGKIGEQHEVIAGEELTVVGPEIVIKTEPEESVESEPSLEMEEEPQADESLMLVKEGEASCVCQDKEEEEPSSADQQTEQTVEEISGSPVEESIIEISSTAIQETHLEESQNEQLGMSEDEFDRSDSGDETVLLEVALQSVGRAQCDDEKEMDQQDASTVVGEFQLIKEFTCPAEASSKQEQPADSCLPPAQQCGADFMDCLIILNDGTPTPSNNASPQPPEPHRSCTSLTEDEQFCSRILALEAKVDRSLELIAGGLNEEFDCFKKMVDEVSAAHTALAEEMSVKAQLLKELLQSAKKIPDPIKAYHLLDRLETTFNMSNHWLAKVVKPKLMAEAKQHLMDYVRITYGGIPRVRSMVASYLEDVSAIAPSEPSAPKGDPYLVQVMTVVDPGEFYITRWCDVKERTRLFAELNEIAPTCPLADPILLGRTYAVFYNNSWHRGVAGQQCGCYMVGNEPPQPLYDFFLLDLGDRERIPSLSVRNLPQDMKDRPPMAKPCTLNSNFQRVQWNAHATSLFKQLVARSPMDMKVFAVNGGILNVDLAQIPIFGEESHIVSVRDTLMLSCKPPAVPTDPPGKKFKPRYSQPFLQSAERPYHLAVIVSSAYNPNNVYVQVEDEEELIKYELMRSDLQAEFRGANAQSASYSASPALGNAYAYEYEGEWYRVLFELTTDGRQQLFYVDTGHRQMYMKPMELHRIPEKYLELPAQAIRCMLDGVFPPGGPGRKPNYGGRKYPREISALMRQFENKQAVIFVERWLPGDVGHPVRVSPKELTAAVVLYLDGDNRSMNFQVGNTAMASLAERRLERAEHHTIRGAIAKKRRGSVSSSSVNAATDESAAPKPDVSQAASSRPESLRLDLAGQSSGAPSVNASYDEERREMSFGHQVHQSAAAMTAALSITPLLIHQPEESFALDSALSAGISSAFADFQRQLSESIEAPPCSEESSTEVVGGRKSFEPLNSFQPEPEAELEKVNEIVAVRGTQPSDAEVTIPVSLIWVDSPDAIYVRTMEEKALFVQLGKQMQAFFGIDETPLPSEYSRPVTNFEVGYKCVVYSDFKWWRAEVVDTECHPDCVVSLLDKGYQKTVPANAIYPLPPVFERQPRLALRCRLFGVYPPSGSAWDANVSTYITSRLAAAESITICCRGRPSKNRADQPLSVMMVYVYDVEGGPLEIPGKTSINLNEELISVGMAKERPVPLPPPSRFLAARPRVSNWKSAEYLKTGTVFWAKGTWVNMKGEIFLQDVRVRNKVREIEDYLGQKYGRSQATEADLRCKEGDLCIAKYVIPGVTDVATWNRGVIKKVYEGKADVLYVDYGTLDAVDLKDIRLNICLDDVPIQVQRCCLFNVKPGEGLTEWPLETLNYVHQIVVDKEFKVSVKGQGPPMPVMMFGDFKVDLHLINKGMAVPIEKILKRKNLNKKKQQPEGGSK